MGLPTDVHGDDGSESGGGVDIRLPPPEYRSTVYRDLSNTGSMSGGGAEDWGAGCLMVVVAFQTRLRTGGQEGGGSKGGLEADGEIRTMEIW